MTVGEDDAGKVIQRSVRLVAARGQAGARAARTQPPTADDDTLQ